MKSVNHVRKRSTLPVVAGDRRLVSRAVMPHSRQVRSKQYPGRWSTATMLDDPFPGAVRERPSSTPATMMPAHLAGLECDDGTAQHALQPRGLVTLTPIPHRLT